MSPAALEPLAALADEVARDLARIDFGGAGWTVPRAAGGEPVLDVAIVGGGQCGIGAAFALLRERIPNILVIDENPAGYEGPWDTYARMQTLRTPKHLTGIDLGVPSLTFRAFWEAQHGAAGWERLGKIARREWMAYLRWFRRVLNLPVRNGCTLERIEPVEFPAAPVSARPELVEGPSFSSDLAPVLKNKNGPSTSSGRAEFGGGSSAEGLYRLHLAGGEVLYARKVVLATGIQGGGEWHVPEFVRQGLGAHRYAHTSAGIGPEAVRGKRIGILGGGASAFDNAHFALDAGAASVDVFLRRRELPRVNPIRFMESIGLPARYPALGDADKYAVMAAFQRHNQPPTNDMFEAAAAFPNFALHLGAPWDAVREEGEAVVVTTPQREHRFDFVILSTGLVTDPALRPELALVADRIARWSDRYAPPAEIANPVLDAHPYLADDFAFTARAPEDQAAIGGIHAFNYSALLSLGLSASALSGIRHALPRLAKGIADALFLGDKDALLAAFFAYEEHEFVGQWPRARLDSAPIAEAAE